MSHGVLRLRNDRDHSEYVTDWRIVWLIAGILLLVTAGSLAAWHWNAAAAVTSTNRVTVLKPPVDAADSASADSNEHSHHSAPITLEIPTPWITRDPMPVPKQQDQVEIRNQPPAPVETHEHVAHMSTLGDEPIATTTVASTSQPFIRMEDELQADLRQKAEEICIESDTGPENIDLADDLKELRTVEQQRERLFFLLAGRPDLDGLPLLTESESRRNGITMRQIAPLARSLPRSRFLPASAQSNSQSSGFDNGPEQEVYIEIAQIEDLQNSKWRRPELISTFVQVLQTATYLVRLEMVSTLTLIDGPEATSALVNLALFDLSQPVRIAAIEALKKRKLDDQAQRKLIQAFRYPWPPVADHAAVTVSGLKSPDLLPDLEKLADLPDPSAPFVGDDGRWRQAELVCVNHFRNCVLCHAVASSPSQVGAGAIPVLGRPLPAEYYSSTDGEFIRSDVTYIRQDFSVMHEVPNADPWPAKQRFDYFIRTRHLSEQESEQAKSKSALENKSSYPQRQALLRTIADLRQLPK